MGLCSNDVYAGKNRHVRRDLPLKSGQGIAFGFHFVGGGSAVKDGEIRFASANSKFVQHRSGLKGVSAKQDLLDERSLVDVLVSTALTLEALKRGIEQSVNAL